MPVLPICQVPLILLTLISDNMTGRSFPRCIRNNNPFNIKEGVNNWIGAIPLVSNTDKNHTFVQFKEMRFGVRAGQKLLLTYIKLYGLDSIEEIISRFAPSTENHTVHYIDFVCRNYAGKLIYEPSTKIDTLEKFAHLCYRICKFESGLNETGCENLHLTPSHQIVYFNTYFKNRYSFNS